MTTVGNIITEASKATQGLPAAKMDRASFVASTFFSGGMRNFIAENRSFVIALSAATLFGTAYLVHKMISEKTGVKYNIQFDLPDGVKKADLEKSINLEVAKESAKKEITARQKDGIVFTDEEIAFLCADLIEIQLFKKPSAKELYVFCSIQSRDQTFDFSQIHTVWTKFYGKDFVESTLLTLTSGEKAVRFRVSGKEASEIVMIEKGGFFYGLCFPSSEVQLLTFRADVTNLINSITFPE
ncbi:MAG: hypothetical protein SNF33_07215 [Candidatus Algichlamydia australiensis]|nr:hypothetical protein [Chlamydiales bacterium]